jgi:hypothetical protein
MRNVYKDSVGRSKVRDHSEVLGVDRRRWNDNIRLDLSETGWEVVDWLRLTQEWDQ